MQLFNGVEDKEITHAANEFVITIPRNSNQAIVENDYKSNQDYKKTNQLHKNLVTRKLTKKEEDIRTFCAVPRTAQEIMDRLKITINLKIDRSILHL